MKKKEIGASEAARYFRVNVRTVQRWLSGDRQIPDWLDVVIAAGKRKP